MSVLENKNKKLGKNKLLVSMLIIGFLLANFFVSSQNQALAEEDISKLNTEISSKKEEIDALQEQIDAYRNRISAKKQEAASLSNQLSILENEIAKVELDIQATEKRVEQTNLEIQSLNIQIQEKEVEINNKKDKLSEYVRLLHQNDDTSYLEVLLMNESFSEFFDYLKQVEEIHGDVKSSVDQLKIARQDLEINRYNLEEKKNKEEDLKIELTKQKNDLDEKTKAQEIVLLQTKLTERQYKNEVYQLQVEQQQVNSDIITLEKSIREELEKREEAKRFDEFGPARLSWPVNPDRGITAFFHDPDYPFRYLFEHPAIDIRASQSTPIKAPESGYVAKVKFAGDTSYAYLMLIHNDGLSTVFGHISSVDVKQDEYVSKGQVVAWSGGMPGTKGAGRLSTGPHLHFEVRLNGIPVNPLEYLPAF